jgi:predicted HD phosphohydrolase
MTTTEPRAAFTTMVESTPADWQIITGQMTPYIHALPERVLDHLRLLDGEFGGFPVDRLTHSLQTAHRAERAGRSDQYVLCALLHDIGDTLGPYDHASIAAAIVRPFVAPELHWMVAKHAEFQGYYFFHHVGGDRDVREAYRGAPEFDLTAEFCADFDQCSFDADYPTPPLEHFAPLVLQLMGGA